MGLDPRKLGKRSQRKRKMPQTIALSSRNSLKIRKSFDFIKHRRITGGTFLFSAVKALGLCDFPLALGTLTCATFEPHFDFLGVFATTAIVKGNCTSCSGLLVTVLVNDDVPFAVNHRRGDMIVEVIPAAHSRHRLEPQPLKDFRDDFMRIRVAIVKSAKREAHRRLDVVTGEKTFVAVVKDFVDLAAKII